MESLKTIFMRRDGLSEKESEDLIEEMTQRVSDGENPEEVLYEVGLEPDYIWEILPW